MTPKSGSFLKALLSRFHPQNEQALLRFFQPEIRETLSEIPHPKNLLLKPILSPSFWVESLHYSWFLPALKNLPPSGQRLFLSLFSREQQKRLCQQLNTTPSLSHLPRFMELFLLERLKRFVLQGETLSLLELPPSEMNSLLELSKAQLVHLVDLLGIHDLAAALRQVVDRTLLGKIHATLTQEQLNFLHYCLKQPLKWVPPKLHIAKWSGDKKMLQKILHQRGLVRLAKALSQEHPSLRWYVMHRFDTGRASILMKLFAGKQDPAMIPYFKSQVLHLVRRYQK